MPYAKMHLNYFEIIEKLLDPSVYLKIYLTSFSSPKIELIKFTGNEEVVLMQSDINASTSKNILDLIHEMSTRLNDGVPPFPQYAKNRIRRKTLDNVVALDYQIYFYKDAEGYILGTVSKEYKKDIYNIFVTANNSLKEAFEALDSKIYNMFSFYPDLIVKNDGTFKEYTTKLIRNKVDFQRNFKSNF